MQEKDLKNISIDNTEEVYTLSTLEGEEKEYRKILEFILFITTKVSK